VAPGAPYFALDWLHANNRKQEHTGHPRETLLVLCHGQLACPCGSNHGRASRPWHPAHHTAAVEFVRTLTLPLATSTYIFDETITLIRAHVGHAAAVRFGEKLRQEQIAKLLRVTEHDEARAWELFVRYQDKGFSFTDCTSFALMERLQLDTAFAFDDHFRQYGKFVVVPQ
jgi:hypothetical protein